MLLQAEASECGLACVAMVAAAHGHPVGLSTLRRLVPAGRDGLDLRQLMRVADTLHLASRALRLEPRDLSEVQLPCILHWDLAHYVVAQRRCRGGLIVLDPAQGRRRLRWPEVSRHFTGIALELTPTPQFQRCAPPPALTWGGLLAAVPGWRSALWPIVLVAVALEAVSVLVPLYSQTVIDEVITGAALELLPVLLWAFGLLLVLHVALGWLRSWLLIRLSQGLGWQWMTATMGHLLHLPVAYFERRHLGDVQSRLGAVDELRHGFTGAALEVVLDGVMALVALGMMLAYAPGLALVVVAAVGAYALLRALVQEPFRQLLSEREVLAGREQSQVLETLRALVPIKLAGREAQRRAQWQRLRAEVQQREVQLAQWGAGLTAARTLLLGAENLLVLALGAWMVVPTLNPAGEPGRATAVSGGASTPLTLGMLVAFLAFKQQFTNRVTALVDRWAALRSLVVQRERLADLVLEPPEEGHARPPVDLHHLVPRLELRDVGFRHGPHQPWVLRGVNLVVDSGDFVALAGPSGAGKTTLLRLILGLLEPTEGQVLYAGQPLKHWGVHNVRRMIGTVLQDDVLVAGTVLENIGFLEEPVDAARAVACAQAAQIHDDIMACPLQYETRLGDLGQGLSGGQRQRLLLARALYRQPRLLLLDEATSHLDPERERALNAVIGALSLTRLVVAHRAETLAAAHRVVVLHPPGASGASGHLNSESIGHGARGADQTQSDRKKGE